MDRKGAGKELGLWQKMTTVRMKTRPWLCPAGNVFQRMKHAPFSHALP